MNLHINHRSDGSWALRKQGGRTINTFLLRREAIRAAKKLKQKGDVIYVHNRAGLIVIRIPEIAKEKVAASVHIHGAPRMTPEGRKEIAVWLRKHANWLLKEGTNYAERFRGRYMYPSA